MDSEHKQVVEVVAGLGVMKVTIRSKAQNVAVYRVHVRCVLLPRLSVWCAARRSKSLRRGIKNRDDERLKREYIYDVCTYVYDLAQPS